MSGGEQKKEESVIDKIYLDEFVERGKRLEDPYLQNIGFWQRKEYVKAVNAFQVEPQQINIFTGMFSYATNIPEQSLFYTTQPVVIEDLQRHLLEKAAAESL